MAVFEGKTALITGGNAGIGRAAAVAFAREGAKVVIAARRSDEGEETVRLVKEAGGEGFFIKTDVSVAADVAAMVEKTVETYGRLDFAFNNAGVEQTPGLPIEEQSEEEFDKVMAVNVKGVWLSMKHQIPAILKSGGGAIVNNSSVAGVVAGPGVAVYTASKHAVIGLTKTYAVEYSAKGVRINAVCPAAIETDMYNRLVSSNQQFKNMLNTAHPIGRIGRSEEVAEAVVWLCSDKASFVTGHSMLVDGGFTAK